MAFDRIEHFLAEQKLQFRLSSFAMEILTDDMFTFQETSLGPFLNEVFTAYYREANASISIRCQELHRDCRDEGMPEETISILCKRLEDSILDVVKKYPSECPVRFYVKDSVMHHLTGKKQLPGGYACREDTYYKRIGSYFKAVVEEYARLPYIKRESIFQWEIIQTINSVLSRAKKRCAIKLSLRNGKQHLVIPYCVVTDIRSLYHYLVAIPYGENAQWMSFRISNIISVDEQEGVSGFLSKERQAQAEQAIQKHGVQFLSAELADVRVRLTASGVKKYQTQLHLRPKYEKIEEDSIYVFRCTETQAEFYFFKFGADAEILEPSRLAEKFKSMYQKAYQLYTKWPL